MKKFLTKAIGSLIATIPIIAAFAMTASANNIASPCMGQPMPPKNLKKYRKF